MRDRESEDLAKQIKPKLESRLRERDRESEDLAKQIKN